MRFLIITFCVTVVAATAAENRPLPTDKFKLDFNVSALEQFNGTADANLTDGVITVYGDGDWTNTRSYLPARYTPIGADANWSDYKALKVTLSAHLTQTNKNLPGPKRRGWITQATLNGADPPMSLFEAASPEPRLAPRLEAIGAGEQLAQYWRNDALLVEISPSFRWYIKLVNNGKDVWQADLISTTISNDFERISDQKYSSNNYTKTKYTFTFNFDDVVDPYAEYPDSMLVYSNVDPRTNQGTGYNKVSRRYRGPTSYPQVRNATCANIANPSQVVELTDTDIATHGNEKNACEAQTGADYSWFPHAYKVPRDSVDGLYIMPHISQPKYPDAGEILELAFEKVELLADVQPKFVDNRLFLNCPSRCPTTGAIMSDDCPAAPVCYDTEENLDVDATLLCDDYNALCANTPLLAANLVDKGQSAACCSCGGGTWSQPPVD